MKLRKLWIFLIAWFLLAAQGRISAESLDCSRIVSLAPSTTQLASELNLGAQLVGISRYCPWPNSSAEPRRIGGLLDLNFEALVQLRPSLVLTLFEHREQRASIERLGIPTLSVDHRNVDGILESITALGESCARSRQARALRASIERRMQSVRSAYQTSPPKRVLVVIGEGAPSGDISDIWVSGSDGFYSDLLRLVGAENVYRSASVSAPTLSQEGILALAPDTILEIVPSRDVRAEEVKEIQARWEAAPLLRGASKPRVIVVSGNKVSIPGPRFIDFLEELALLIHK